MEELCNSIGHCYLHIDMIYKYTIMCLGNNINEEYFIECINSLILDIKVIKVEEKYYLRNMWDAEENIVSRVVSLNNKSDYKINNIDGYIEELEKNKKIEYNNEQKEAIKKAIEKNFLIITGGPGTGKTTIISSIIDIYQKVNKLSFDLLVKELVVLAPTGRASKRLSEKSLFPASTIHSFLKWNKETDKFAINEYNKSDAKMVIIDESSMIDVPLFYSLLKGLRIDTRIIMVGDYDQLPSVGPGQLLKDLIESDLLNVISLKELYRQAMDSNIISLAHDINNGEVNESLFNVNYDLDFIKTDNIVDSIKEIADTYKDESYNDFQVLVPMYKGLNGIDALNEMMGKLFNSENKKVQVGDNYYRINDKVIQLVNDVDNNVFNGDIGYISDIYKIEKKTYVEIDFIGNKVTYTNGEFDRFSLAYAISIHKAQGSEYDNVVIILAGSFKRMFYNKLIYTGITRAKKSLMIIGNIDSLNTSVQTSYAQGRKTYLKTLIKE
jgi:exodeoxyribonuclease V alpha subunit